MNQAEQINDAVGVIKKFYETKNTLAYTTRIDVLKKLKSVLLKREDDVYFALKNDLNKSVYESYMTEYALVISEIEYVISHLKKWMRPKRLGVGLTQFPASARLYSEPYGVVLIMSPWNYPFQLTMVPLIGALAAGNCAVIKPSAYAPKTSQIIDEIISEALPNNYVKVITGGREENQALLTQAFDYIFFTGSPAVGRIVMEKAAHHLTPLTLELGGKSPCIVEKTADIEKTARRILFGKLLNSGQTCVAPDYLLVQQDVKNTLINQLIKVHKEMLGNTDYFSNYFPKIVNGKHFKRLIQLFENSHVVYGGTYNEKAHQIDFTLIENPDLEGELMQEEIFGPILPIITWQTADEVVDFVNCRPKPLALYAFTKDRQFEQKITRQLSYGGGCINDTILHISSHAQPFGGVGNSGIGNYHGKWSFQTFSHHKTVLKKWWHFDAPVRYHPYKKPKEKLPFFLFK